MSPVQKVFKGLTDEEILSQKCLYKEELPDARIDGVTEKLLVSDFLSPDQTIDTHNSKFNALLGIPPVYYSQQKPQILSTGCGYRSIQMMCSSLIQHPNYRRVMFGGCGYVPDIYGIMGWIERAWYLGFDPSGADQLGWTLRGSLKEIGSTECWALLRSFGIPVQLASFYTPESQHILYLGGRELFEAVQEKHRKLKQQCDAKVRQVESTEREMLGKVLLRYRQQGVSVGELTLRRSSTKKKRLQLRKKGDAREGKFSAAPKSFVYGVKRTTSPHNAPGSSDDDGVTETPKFSSGETGVSPSQTSESNSMGTGAGTAANEEAWDRLFSSLDDLTDEEVRKFLRKEDLTAIRKQICRAVAQIRDNYAAAAQNTILPWFVKYFLSSSSSSSPSQSQAHPLPFAVYVQDPSHSTVVAGLMGLTKAEKKYIYKHSKERIPLPADSRQKYLHYYASIRSPQEVIGGASAASASPLGTGFGPSTTASGTTASGALRFVAKEDLAHLRAIAGAALRTGQDATSRPETEAEKGTSSPTLPAVDADLSGDVVADIDTETGSEGREGNLEGSELYMIRFDPMISRKQREYYPTLKLSGLDKFLTVAITAKKDNSKEIDAQLQKMARDKEDSDHIATATTATSEASSNIAGGTHRDVSSSSEAVNETAINDRYTTVTAETPTTEPQEPRFAQQIRWFLRLGLITPTKAYKHHEMEAVYVPRGLEGVVYDPGSPEYESLKELTQTHHWPLAD